VGAVSLASVAENVPSVPTDDLVRASKSLKTRDDFKRSTTMANKVDGEGGRILGTFDAVDGKGIVRMEDMLDTNIEDVWSALTDRSRLARWYGEIEADLRPGGEYRARLLASGWEGSGRVGAFDPPQRLLVRITDSEEPDEQEIEITLTPDGDQTLVVWEERGMPLPYLSAYAAGVQLHVEDLADYLAARERREDFKARWDELHPAYQALEKSRS
jgi:uncharacterized protein YndB with AHSA1/START domain